jgi:hypothetical protein
MNLWVVKNLAIGALLKQLNPNKIDITKVSSMPLKNEKEKIIVPFCNKKKLKSNFKGDGVDKFCPLLFWTWKILMTMLHYQNLMIM